MPATSCMYSIDLRYHWLLNDEKWCIDELHCSYTSLWHRPQAALVVKKSAGMILPLVVSADDGKNGRSGPPPSASIFNGGTRGLAMRYRSRSERSLRSLPPAARPSSATAMAGERSASRRARGPAHPRAARTIATSASA